MRCRPASVMARRRSGDREAGKAGGSSILSNADCRVPVMASHETPSNAQVLCSLGDAPCRGAPSFTSPAAMHCFFSLQRECVRLCRGRIIPTGQAHLLLNLEQDEFRRYSGVDCTTVHRTDGAVLAGPHGCSTALDTKEQRRLIAVEFKLGGAAAFLPMPLSDACDQVIGLDHYRCHPSIRARSTRVGDRTAGGLAT